MESITGNVNNLIALCHILDEFADFEKKLMPLISPKYNRDFVSQLAEISEGKGKLGARKAKKFYNENKLVIDTINKYSSIILFINGNYDEHGKPDENFQCFYQYFLNHKNNLEQILSVLEKLKKLGFRKFSFDENANFTDNEYSIYILRKKDNYIEYLDNMKAIPCYQSDVIKYRTTESKYCISVREKDQNITLNSLLFDPSRLPEILTTEYIFDKIFGLKEEQKHVYSIIRNSIDLSINVAYLKSQFMSIIEVMNRLDNKEDLQDALIKIKEGIAELQTVSSSYDDSVSREDPSITKEILEQEKANQLKLRAQSRYIALLLKDIDL